MTKKERRRDRELQVAFGLARMITDAIWGLMSRGVRAKVILAFLKEDTKRTKTLFSRGRYVAARIASKERELCLLRECENNQVEN